MGPGHSKWLPFKNYGGHRYTDYTKKKKKFNMGKSKACILDL